MLYYYRTQYEHEWFSNVMSIFLMSQSVLHYYRDLYDHESLSYVYFSQVSIH